MQLQFCSNITHLKATVTDTARRLESPSVNGIHDHDNPASPWISVSRYRYRNRNPEGARESSSKVPRKLTIYGYNLILIIITKLCKESKPIVLAIIYINYKGNE